MSLTLSMDASVKVKAQEVRGFLGHVGRDTFNAKERAWKRHANPNINKARTWINTTMVRDGDSYTICGGIEEIVDAIDLRLEKVKKPLRSDAVIVRPLLIQLDPNFYKGMDVYRDREKIDASVDCMLSWIKERFGEENIVAYSTHLDEAAPHVHVVFVPVTDDGRLSQKDWFENRLTLKQMHTDFRNHMIAEGYDIDLTRKPVRDHMNDNDYRDFKAIEAENKKLEKKQEHIDTVEAATNQLLMDAQAKLQEATEKEREASQKLQDAQEHERRNNEKENSLKLRDEALNASQEQLNQDRKQLNQDKRKFLEQSSTFVTRNEGIAGTNDIFKRNNDTVIAYCKKHNINLDIAAKLENVNKMIDKTNDAIKANAALVSSITEDIEDESEGLSL